MKTSQTGNGSLAVPITLGIIAGAAVICGVVATVVRKKPSKPRVAPAAAAVKRAQHTPTSSNPRRTTSSSVLTRSKRAAKKVGLLRPVFL
jgi:flagellar basal body-associated protein FliL